MLKLMGQDGITAEQRSGWFMEETEVPGRVPRGVEHAERWRAVEELAFVQEVDFVVLFERIEKLGKRSAKEAQVFAGEAMHIDIRIGHLVDLRHPADVIEMAVGEENGLQSIQRAPHFG